MKYLENYKIKDRQYTTGLFDSGITIYKQQVRALNIFYAMHRCGLIDKNSRICIVGGGIAGLTIAAALLEANIGVTVVEKESTFLHLQYQCDIRQVHPNIYEWPAAGSTYPHAKLPILPWKADSASNVARQIVQSFYNLQSKRENSEFYLDISDNPKLTITQNEGDDYFNIRFIGKQNGKDIKKATVTSNYIIYCTGFGIEKGTESDKTHSYWRNDDYSQTIVNDRHKFFISGTGDGALVDLFRLKILGFSYDSFLIKYNSNKHEEAITSILKEIKKKWPSRDRKVKDWVLRNFEKINPDDLRCLYEYMKCRIRKDTEVTLIGNNKQLHLIYDLDKISLINAFIFYLLQLDDLNAFNYNEGKTELINGNYHLVNEDKNKVVHEVIIPATTNLILRHGTDRQNAFSGTDINDEDLKNLKNKQESPAINPDMQLWNYGSLMPLFENSGPPKGYITNETIAFCSNFISTLNKMIKLVCELEKIRGNYKLTLLRVLQSGNQHYYQQISPYYGTNNSEGNVGKVYPFRRGNVGISIITREPLVLINNINDIDEIVDIMGLNDAKNIMQSKSFLSIPILAEVGDERVANIILYVDSNSETFFNNDKIIFSIVKCLEGLIESVHKLIGKQLFMEEVISEPIATHIDKKELKKIIRTIEKVKKSACYVNILERFPELSSNSTTLVFKKFYSFDIYHNKNIVDINDLLLN